MKKEDIASLFVYLIMIGVAVIVGLTAARDSFILNYNINWPSYLFAIVVIIVGLLVNIGMLEVCHIIGAKIGGYAVLSVNILGICWKKTENKWKIGFSDFDGLTGETKITPKKEDAKLTAYIWLPVLMYFLELAACIVIITLAEDKNVQPTSPLKWMSIAALLVIIISSLIALYNLIPIKLDSMTDGYRLMLSTKKENIDAFNELMRIEALRMEGKEIGEVKIFENITEFTASINLISVYEKLNTKDFKKAEELIDMIIVDPSKVSPTTYHRLLAQKLYIKVMTLPKEELAKYYEEEVGDPLRKFLANDLSMESLRTYILIAGLLDKSHGEVEFAKSRKERALKKCVKSRVNVEQTLYEEALEKVYSEHPDWKENK